MLFLFLYLLFSATDKPNQNLVFRNACQDFTFDNNSLLLDAQVGQLKGNFALDFGNREPALFQKATVQTTNNYEIINSLFYGDAEFLSELPIVNECNNVNEINGRLGYSLFDKSNRVIYFDFDSEQICCLSSSEFDALVKEGYVETKASFRSDAIYIPIEIKWKKYYLKFDTGFTGTVFMNQRDAAAFLKEQCKMYENATGSSSVYPNKWITFSGSYYNSAVAVAAKGTSKIGIGFLKGFNWIIDFRNQKMYAKKNTISLDAENVFPPDLQAKVRKGKLIVISKNVGAIFPIGSTITAVNGTPVTSENLCDMEALIQNTKNLKQLDIQITPD